MGRARGYATVFPQAIGMGATWDPQIGARHGQRNLDEARAKYNQAQREATTFLWTDVLVPQHNISALRCWDWPGDLRQDPFLIRVWASAFTLGVQVRTEHPGRPWASNILPHSAGDFAARIQCRILRARS